MRITHILTFHFTHFPHLPQVGHTFGFSHDDDTPCGANGDTMGGGEWQSWSQCSMDTFYEKEGNGDYNCL